MHAIFFEPPLENNFIEHQLVEIYLDKIYQPVFRDKKDLTILDVGAFIGLTSYYFSRFAKVVYAFEPSLAYFDLLSRMLVFNEIKNVLPFRLALYLENNQFPFYHSKLNHTSSSLNAVVNVDNQPSEIVETITLDKFFTEQKIEHVDLLKLDVEGSEIEILSSQGFKKVAERIDNLVIESHAWAGRHPNQLQEALKNNGYKVEPVPNIFNATLWWAKR